MNSESVPSVFVLLSPCAKFTHSFPQACVFVSLVTGYFASVWYLETFLRLQDVPLVRINVRSILACWACLHHIACAGEGSAPGSCHRPSPQNLPTPLVKLSVCFGILLVDCMWLSALISLLSTLVVAVCPFRKNWYGIVFSKIVFFTGLWTTERVVNFSFCVGDFLTLALAHLSIGASYRSDGCDVYSDGATGGVLTLVFGRVITLELCRSMPSVLARVVCWWTRGVVLITTGAVGWVYFWRVGAFTLWISPVFSLKISANFASAVAWRVGCCYSSFQYLDRLYKRRLNVAGLVHWCFLWDRELLRLEGGLFTRGDSSRQGKE